jgi:hypothetical protein
MNFTHVKVTGKVSHETFGCQAQYFANYIKDKPLLIVFATSNHYIRVQDQNQEEWGLFPGQYAICTGLASQEIVQASEAGKEILPQEQAR